MGLHRLGHEVVYFEHYGWPESCYNPVSDSLSSDPSYGIEFLTNLFSACDISPPWCYLDEGDIGHGIGREELAQHGRECDLYINLSNINWIPELKSCRRRILVDTDPVFTQIKAHGMGGPFSRYDVLFSYGENVHRPGCSMPVGGARWLPTRQPVVLDLWPVEPLGSSGPFTTVMNWSATGEHEYEGRAFGQKDREFGPFFELPQNVGQPMELAVNAPPEIKDRLRSGGWRLADPLQVTRGAEDYQRYLAGSRAEFSVAKHGYVVTNSGWFSDRSCGYLASGRPVILQDTGFSGFLPTGEGLLSFSNYDEAVGAIASVSRDPDRHGRAARRIAEEYFDANVVLNDLLERAL